MSVNSSEGESLVFSDTLTIIEKRQHVQQGLAESSKRSQLYVTPREQGMERIYSHPMSKRTLYA